MKNSLIISLCLFLLLILSCKKERIYDGTENYNNGRSTCNDIGFVGMDEGKLHNELVVLIVDNWTSCSSNQDTVLAEIKDILLNESQSIVEDFNINYDTFKHVLTTYWDNMAFFDWDDDPINFVDSVSLSVDLESKTLALADTIQLYSDNDESVSVSKTAFCDYYDYNYSALSDTNDLKIFGGMADLAMNSVKLWLPTADGGDNLYDDFEDDYSILCSANFENADPRGWWGSIILADAIGVVTGAAGALAVNPLLALPNPATGGIPIAGIVGVINGAGNSATAAIALWNV